jgi:hypothetical protein
MCHRQVRKGQQYKTLRPLKAGARFVRISVELLRLLVAIRRLLRRFDLIVLRPRLATFDAIKAPGRNPVARIEVSRFTAHSRGAEFLLLKAASRRAEASEIDLLSPRP